MEASTATSETVTSHTDAVQDSQQVPLTGQATEFFASMGAVWTSGTKNAWQAVKPVTDSAAAYVPQDMKKAFESSSQTIKGVFSGSVSPVPLYRAEGSVTPPVSTDAAASAAGLSPHEPGSVVADAGKAISNAVTTVGERLNEAAVYTSNSAKGAYESLVQTVKQLPMPALGKGMQGQDAEATATGEATGEHRGVFQRIAAPIQGILPGGSSSTDTQ